MLIQGMPPMAAIKGTDGTVKVKSKFYPHPAQTEIIKNPARFKIILAGRRFGKSLLCVDECIETALTGEGRKIYYCAPLYRQAKEIAWKMLLEYLPPEVIRKTNESDLDVECINGSTISLKGCDHPESLVGVSLDLAILDECAQYKPEVWYRIIRPMLMDRGGRAMFITTPAGFNWFYELWKSAENDPEFARFRFKTVDNGALPNIVKEVEKLKAEAKSEYERLLFRQECEASFEAVTGRPRFDLTILRQLMEKAEPPIGKMGVLRIYHAPPNFNLTSAQALSGAPLRKYTPVRGKAVAPKGEKYVIGVDTSEGLSTGDNSSAVVVDCDKFRVAAEFAGTMPPDELATNLVEWAKAYSNALVVVESNNHGILTLDHLKKSYHNLYYRHVKDEQADRWTQKLGFLTGPRTKPILVGAIDKALRDGLQIPSKEVIEELMTYVVEDNGMTNAQEGAHDDLVMALGCALQGYADNAPVKTEEPEPELKIPRFSYAAIEKEMEKEKNKQDDPVPSYWDF